MVNYYHRDAFSFSVAKSFRYHDAVTAQRNSLQHLLFLVLDEHLTVRHQHDNDIDHLVAIQQCILVLHSTLTLNDTQRVSDGVKQPKRVRKYFAFSLNANLQKHLTIRLWNTDSFHVSHNNEHI